MKQAPGVKVVIKRPTAVSPEQLLLLLLNNTVTDKTKMKLNRHWRCVQPHLSGLIALQPGNCRSSSSTCCARLQQVDAIA